MLNSKPLSPSTANGNIASPRHTPRNANVVYVAALGPAWKAGGDRRARFHRIVTIGTPHRGTAIARHARARNGIEMQLESPWLDALGATRREQRVALHRALSGREAEALEV